MLLEHHRRVERKGPIRDDDSDSVTIEFSVVACMLKEKPNEAQFKEKFSEPSNLNELRATPLHFTSSTVRLLTSPLQTATVTK